MRKVILGVLFSVMVIGLSAFTYVEKDTNIEAANAPKELKIGDMAPDFELQGSDGKMHKLSDFRGKMVVMDFWAMWCGPCKKKMPKIQQLHESYKSKGVEVLGMLAMNKGAEEKAKSYFADKNYTFKLLYGNTKLTKDYNLKFLPTVIVVDKKGKIVYLTTKPNPNEFTDIKALIAKK